MSHSRKSIYIFLGAGCALVAAIIATVAMIEAHRQNQFSLETQKAVIAFETNDAYLDMLGQIKHAAYDRVAYDNIVRQWNPSWIQQKFTDHLSLIGIHNAALIGADGTIKRVDSDEGLTPKALTGSQGLNALLKAVRTNRAQGKIAPQKGIIIIDGKIYFSVAAMLSPQASGQETGPAPLPVMTFFKPADSDFYDLLKIGFAAENLHLALREHSHDGFASFPLLDASGKPAAYVHWQPHRPGASFLIVLFPALVIIFVALAVALALAARRWRTAQSKLVDSEAKIAAALEESRIKMLFLGNVSHELRTPLNAIIGFSEMLRMQPFGPLGAKQYEEYIGDILFSSHELLTIVNDLMEITNISADNFKLETEPFDAAPCLADVVQDASQLAAEHGITLDYQGDKQGAWCMCAPSRLRQAASRLLANALKVSGEGDIVAMVCRRDEDGITITVSDNGEAPSPQAVEDFGKLFLDNHDHYIARKDGLKLGLVVAAGLVHAMDGEITIAPAGKTGTIVTVRLPVAEAPAQVQAA